MVIYINGPSCIVLNSFYRYLHCQNFFFPARNFFLSVKSFVDVNENEVMLNYIMLTSLIFPGKRFS